MCDIFLIEKASVPVSITLAFIAGVAATLQAGISGQLANELNDGIMAALISNIGGTIFTGLFLLNPNVRKQAKKLFKAVISGNFAKWQLLGGVAGAVYISTASSTVSVIGTGLFTVVLVASQNISGIVVDKFGFSSGSKRRITPKRALAAIVGIVAVLLSVSEFEGKILWLPIFAVIIAGLAVTIQFALNGRVTKASSSQVSAFINFPMSLLAVLITLIVMNLFGKNWNSWPEQWWLYSAGFLGAVVVYLAAATIRTLGVLLFGLASVAGQLITSIALDVILPNANINVGWALISGAGLMLLAVYLASDLR